MYVREVGATLGLFSDEALCSLGGHKNSQNNVYLTAENTVSIQGQLSQMLMLVCSERNGLFGLSFCEVMNLHQCATLRTLFIFTRMRCSSSKCVLLPEEKCSRLLLKCDGTRAETRFRLSAKRTSPFKSAGGVSSVDYWQPRCAHQR